MSERRPYGEAETPRTLEGEEARRFRRAVGRYSRFVDTMRYLLPTTALVLVVLLVAWPYLAGEQSGLIVPRVGQDGIEVDPMRMQNPRYVGHGRDDRPYEVTASSALLDPSMPDIVHLDELEAGLAQPSRDLALAARSGIYDREARRLDLSGGIDLVSSDGYRFRTELVGIDLDSGRLEGSQAIEGEGPAGTLAADSFWFNEGGSVLQFEGRVRATFHASPPPPPPVAPDEPSAEQGS